MMMLISFPFLVMTTTIIVVTRQPVVVSFTCCSRMTSYDYDPSWTAQLHHVSFLYNQYHNHNDIDNTKRIISFQRKIQQPRHTKRQHRHVMMMKQVDNNNKNQQELYSRNETRTIPMDLQPPLYNLRKESLLFDETSATLYNNNMVRFWIVCQTYLPRIIHGARRKRSRKISHDTKQKVSSIDHKQTNQINQAYYTTTPPTTTTSSQNTDISSNNQNEMNHRHHEEDINDHPIAYLYNMFFVRIPIILTGIFYLYQLLYQGHPLICDFGFYGGPFEVPPLIVLGILYLILL
jgi:hypothetical protein